MSPMPGVKILDDPAVRTERAGLRMRPVLMGFPSVISILSKMGARRPQFDIFPLPADAMLMLAFIADPAVCTPQDRTFGAGSPAGVFGSPRTLDQNLHVPSIGGIRNRIADERQPHLD